MRRNPRPPGGRVSAERSPFEWRPTVRNTQLQVRQATTGGYWLADVLGKTVKIPWDAPFGDVMWFICGRSSSPYRD